MLHIPSHTPQSKAGKQTKGRAETAAPFLC